jgi:hypothetical protein
MKLIFIVFLTIKIFANENWIKINPINKANFSKQTPNQYVDLSQKKPIDMIVKNITIIKKLIDATNKTDKTLHDDKKWFILNTKSK